MDKFRFPVIEFSVETQRFRFHVRIDAILLWAIVQSSVILIDQIARSSPFA